MELNVASPNMHWMGKPILIFTLRIKDINIGKHRYLTLLIPFTKSGFKTDQIRQRDSAEHKFGLTTNYVAPCLIQLKVL